MAKFEFEMMMLAVLSACKQSDGMIHLGRSVCVTFAFHFLDAEVFGIGTKLLHMHNVLFLLFPTPMNGSAHNFLIQYFDDRLCVCVFLYKIAIAKVTASNCTLQIIQHALV